jgi:quinol monooxygenase YgiN
MTAVHVIAVWVASAGRRDEILGILRELRERSRAEPGCAGFDVRESLEEPGRFVLLEDYADVAARARHQGCEHFTHLVLERAAPLLELRHVSAYRPIDQPIEVLP